MMSEQQDNTRARYLKRFSEAWSELDTTSGFFVASPGRVNLIGEHIDYNNCPVLPIAVDKRVLAYVVPLTEKTIKVADLNVTFGTVEFSFSSDTSIKPYPTGHWGNYIKAAVNQLLEDSFEAGEPEYGFAMVMGSDIPQAAGMSSSSAIVVLSAIALLESNGVSVSTDSQRLLLSDICSRAEWYVGTKGGGMDQAAILLGKKDHATKISFNPLYAQQIPFGQASTIVVAHCTIEAPKTRQMMLAYNRRSIECSLAAAIVAKYFSDSHGIDGITYIGDLTEEKLGWNREALANTVLTLFHEEPYSVEEIAKLLHSSEDIVREQYLKARDRSDFPIPEDGFKLCQRFFHVFNEWQRVEEAATVLEAGDMKALGALMNDSHYSCRDYHEVSCPELDILTEIARTHGALGSRLTGAGFGGCTVNLVPPESLESFIQALLELYYRDHLQMEADQARQYVFVVKPSDGAGRIIL